ncbi:hypothetical protein D9M68_953420 [compost metagenome]
MLATPANCISEKSLWLNMRPVLAPKLTECLLPKASNLPSTARSSVLLSVLKSNRPPYITLPARVTGFTAPSGKAYLMSCCSRT